MLENKFQANLIKELKERFPGCIVMKNDPTYIQGIPDLLVLHKDKWASLECKKSAGAKKQPNQEYYVDRMNQMSFSRFICPENKEETELATALNVGSINTAEQFEGKTRTTSDSKKKKLVAIIANLADYSLGATKGGEVTHFTQFDIDFNQEKSLLETRCSGALTRVYSAIAIEEDVTTASSGSEDHTA